MEINEAIKYLKTWNPLHPMKKEATKLAIAILEKQIPVEPVVADAQDYPKLSKLYYCGDCKSRINGTKGHKSYYCPYCGKKVKW